MKTELLISTDRPATKLAKDMKELEAAAREQLLKDGLPETRIRFSRSLDWRYVGQGYELRIPIADGNFDDDSCERAWGEFHNRHRSEYDHCFPENPIEVVSLRVTGLGLMPRLPEEFEQTAAAKLGRRVVEDGRDSFSGQGNTPEIAYGIL